VSSQPSPSFSYNSIFLRSNSLHLARVSLSAFLRLCLISLRLALVARVENLRSQRTDESFLGCEEAAWLAERVVTAGFGHSPLRSRCRTVVSSVRTPHRSCRCVLLHFLRQIRPRHVIRLHDRTYIMYRLIGLRTNTTVISAKTNGHYYTHIFSIT
jgi:hypothetical protein